MKKIITITAIVICSLNMFSQEGKIFIEANYNTFSHASLSNFQKEFIDDLPPQIPIATTDDFPNNIGFTFGYEIVDSQVSIFAGYNATGGKLSYSDFSGVIRLEQQLNAFTLGGMYHFNLDDDEHFKLGFKGFTMISSLEIDNFTRINNNQTQEDVKFNAIDFGAGASLIYEYPISFFMVRASLGYDLVFGGKLNFDNIDNAHLINDSGEDVTTGWSGLRTGLGIAIPLN